MSTQATAPDKFTEFVLEHENDDTARLLLSKGRWKDVDIDLAVNTILSRRKLRDKVPAWYSHAGLVYPAKLSAEQCSSQDTAGYKAGLALRLHRGQAENCSHLHRSSRAVSILDAPEDWNNPLPAPDLHIADLTGGLGVDSWAFSKVAGSVFYNEMDPALAHAARHNFLTLGASGNGPGPRPCRPAQFPDSGRIRHICAQLDTLSRIRCRTPGRLPPRNHFP